MATFTFPEHFKEHKQYVVLLKKALLQVKPDTQKKFLYFKQYPFGPKKLPLVLVDFDLNCPAALAKAGHKPTDDGMVSLTPQDELNFEPKKGNLKRTRLKKYFATMGGGMKAVFVPPGEVDEEGDQETTEVAQGTNPSQPLAANRPAPPDRPATPPPVAPGMGKQMERKMEFEENEFKRRQLLARVQELQATSSAPALDPLKKEVLAKATALAQENRFPDANALLDQLATRLKNTPAPQAVPASPPAAPGMGKQMERKVEFEESEFKRRELAKRIDELTKRAVAPQSEAAKKLALQKAQSLAEAKNFAEAIQVLDQFVLTLRTLPSRPPPPTSPPPAPAQGPREIKLSTYLSGRANLRAARESAAKELQRLRDTILSESKGEPFYEDVEKKSQKLFEYLGPIDDSVANKLDDASKCPDPELQIELHKQVRNLIQKQLASLRDHPLAPFVEKNPFGKFIIKQPLEVTLSALDKQLS
jgi:hypothetical protein